MMEETNKVTQLFQHRFGRKEVTSEAYFTRLIYYIHFNPQHHGLIDDFSDWPYSSYHSILSKSKTALQREDVLEWFGGRDYYKAFHEENAADITPIFPLIEEDELYPPKTSQRAQLLRASGARAVIVGSGTRRTFGHCEVMCC